MAPQLFRNLSCDAIGSQAIAKMLVRIRRGRTERTYEKASRMLRSSLCAATSSRKLGVALASPMLTKDMLHTVRPSAIVWGWLCDTGSNWYANKRPHTTLSQHAQTPA